jgi:hypothetical protein
MNPIAIRASKITKTFPVRRSWVRTILHPLDRPQFTALREIDLEVRAGEGSGWGAGAGGFIPASDAGPLLPDRGV